jgi:tRNA(fMet)-specific endonuclease VapC
VTIISFQEQFRGWMSFLNRARTSEDILKAYSRLEAVFRYYCNSNPLPFEPEAQTHFVDLRRQKVGIGTLDLRIASIALAMGSTVLTRNLRDFRKVPGLVVEDWTQ